MARFNLIASDMLMCDSGGLTLQWVIRVQAHRALTHLQKLTRQLLASSFEFVRVVCTQRLSPSQVWLRGLSHRHERDKSMYKSAMFLAW